ncbi:MAG: hypothetical protein F6K10_32080, partial [Moorea sp. SIO2B7]|nr:hypothetical protein [Moorena sp. SIO2B7]
RNKYLATLILTIVICIQLIDISPLIEAKRTLNSASINTEIISEQWRELNIKHSKLYILPAHQCKEEKPTESFQEFAKLAASQNLKLNSMYVARIGKKSFETHCEDIPNKVKTGILEKDTAYVFSQKLFNEVSANNNIITHTCSTIDNFILCQTNQ